MDEPQLDLFGAPVEEPQVVLELEPAAPACGCAGDNGVVELQRAPEESTDAEPDPQLTLLDVAPDWREHWQGMPEYIHGDYSPVQMVVVKFLRKEDVRAFAQLIGQTISALTDSVWFPKLKLEEPKHYRWVDESSLPDLHPEQGAR